MEIIKLSKPKKTIWGVIGFIFFPITGTMFYSNFFERELFLNRRNLYRYLLENRDVLNNYRTDGIGYLWEFTGYRLWLWKKTNLVSLHDERGWCIINSFHSGFIDSYYYSKIKKLLIGARACQSRF